MSDNVKVAVVSGLTRKIEGLRNKVLMQSIDIQIEDKLLFQHREAIREAWDKIAKIEEQIGRKKVKVRKTGASFSQ